MFPHVLCGAGQPSHTQGEPPTVPLALVSSGGKWVWGTLGSHSRASLLPLSPEKGQSCQRPGHELEHPWHRVMPEGGLEAPHHCRYLPGLGPQVR